MKVFFRKKEEEDHRVSKPGILFGITVVSFVYISFIVRSFRINRTKGDYNDR